jgi:hypothetical protein
MKMTMSHKGGSTAKKASKAGISRVASLFAVFAIAVTAVFSLSSPTSLFNHFATGFSFGSANPFGSTPNNGVAPESKAAETNGGTGESSSIGFITTDKTDYNPGETVIITGSGWEPHELVSFEIKREGVFAANYQTHANEFGNVYHREFVIGDEDLGATFTLRAAGSNSGNTAESRFTDGALSYSPANFNFAGATAVISGTTAVEVVFDQTVISPNDDPKGFKAAVKVTPNSTTFSGNATSPFPAGFIVSTNPGEVTFNQNNQGKPWNVKIRVPANTIPGFYSALIGATPDAGTGHTSGTVQTQVILEVKSPAPTDVTAPTTSANAGSYASSTWTNQNVTLNLSATDNPNGTGVRNITYTVSGAGGPVTNTIPGSSTSIVISAAGSSTVTYFATDNANNAETPRDFFVNIDKTKPVITLNGNSPMEVTYGNAFTDPKGIATDNVAPLISSVDGFGTVDTDTVGQYTLTYNYNDVAGNAADQVTRTVNVVKAGQTITFGPLDGKAYGDADFTVSATASSNLPVSFAASGNCSVTSDQVHITGAGSCSITASQAGNTSYIAAVSVQQTFSIGKANATIVVTPYDVTFDGTPHTATATITGVNGETGASVGTVNLSGTIHTDAGTYSNDKWSFTGAANYNDIAETVITNKIRQASQAIAVNTGAPATATYGTTFGVAGAGGGSNNPVVITVTGVCVGGGNNNATITMTSGTGICTVKYNQAGNNNYTAAQEVSSPTAAQKAGLNITASSSAITYGDPAPTVTPSYTSFIPGDTAANSLSVQPLCTTTYTAGSPVSGSYTTSCNGAASDKYSFTYLPGTVTVNKADATCGITGFDGIYDGNAHGAVGNCTGIGGIELAGLSRGDSFTNVPGGNAKWSFIDADGNYNDQSGFVDIKIAKADANISVQGYSGTYDGNSHGATGTATGVEDPNPADLNSLLSLGDSFINVSGGTAHWNFAGNNNYKSASGSVVITINKAHVSCDVTGFTGTYDGSLHGLSGSCKGVKGETLSGLNLGASFTDFPGGTANWSFTDVTGNYNNKTATAVQIVINKATPTVTIGFAASPVIWSGSPFPATVTVTGVNGVLATPANGTVAITYKSGINVLSGAPVLVGNYTASAAFTSSNLNYNNAVTTADASLTINTGYCFNGFLSPVGGSVEGGNGGSINDPVRAFKLGSTIPFKFVLYNLGCTGAPITTGVHTIRLSKGGNTTDQDAAIDATPTDSATTGNQFRLTDSEWHYNLDTKKTAGITTGTWLVEATLQDGSKKTVWISIKK